MTNLQKDVADHCGQELQKSKDLKTNACCRHNADPKHNYDALSLLPEGSCY